MTAPIATAEHAPPRRFTVRSGRPHPLGATPDAEGTNFALFTRHATSVELLIFERHDSPKPVKTITLDPSINRTFYFWHVYVYGVTSGMCYAYRVDGPQDLHGSGHRFNPNKVLIDPYGRGTTSTLWDRVAACGPEDNLTKSLRSVVIDMTDYDWEGDEPLRKSMQDTVIYEMHVRGFTKSPTSGAANPGTYLGVIEKIPYLQKLGVTAVELLPVFEFDEAEISGTNPLTGQQLINYWGYSPISFFNPHEGYCVAPDEGSHVREFRDMVKAFHKAGIEVILDVVFNHTGEGNHEGPTISFRGLDNPIYYHLEPYDKQFYTNLSGCGNTFNCNVPLVEKFIAECLLFWVREMHVDGFRFDLASILSRGPDGNPMDDPPVLWHIELDNELSDTKIIAEAWDAGGLYQVGYFPGFRWAEWNGRFRDDVRRWVKGDKGLVSKIAARIAGSADIYQADGELPINSINFITAHDGFTLNDLVSYNGKHNEANGEGNRDGTDDNLSWNHGVEGDTDDPEVEALRSRQVRNFQTILMLSQGVPMMVMGDEARQTQFGNNNAYCQDNEITWFDWKRAGDARRPDPLHQRAHRLPEGAPDAAPLALLHRRAQRARPGRHLVARLPDLLAGLGRPRVAGPRLHPRRLPDPGQRQVRRHRHPRHDEHGLGRPRLRYPEGRGPPLVSSHRHRRAGAGRHPFEGARAALGGRHLHRSRTEASWCSSRSRDAGTASAQAIDRGGSVMAVKTAVGTGQEPRRKAKPKDAMAFSFADTIAGYVKRYDRNADSFTIETSDGREFTVGLTDTTGAQIVRNLGEPYVDATAQMRDMLVPGRYLFTYGVFYPAGRDARLRREDAHVPGRPRARLRPREARLVGQADLPDGRLLLPLAVRRRRAELARVPGRHRHDRQQGRRPPGDRHDLAPDLRPRRAPTR